MSHGAPLDSEARPPQDETGPGQKARQFPAAPGVYLLKDAQGRVLYVGKAKNLRHRAGHYFTPAALEDRRTADLVKLVCDVDCIPADSEVDALLMEARLIKDIQPRFNVDLKDDKTFPYLQIRTREDFPRVEFTRTPRRRGVKLYGPFTSAKKLRQAMQLLQRIFKFRTCALDIEADDSRWRWFRPCILHSIRQCTAPCNFRVTREEYRKQIRALRLVLEGKKAKLLREMAKEMQEASAAMQFERAARLRDDIAALKNLSLRGDVDKNFQPEVFHIDPKRGLAGLRKVLGLPNKPRTIEGIDIAHTGGGQTVASLVQFIDAVHVRQSNRSLDSNDLQIYLREESDEIERIEAYENVDFRMNVPPEETDEETPRASLMTVIEYEIFDDLMIGNFTKTTLHGPWPRQGTLALYPDFIPFVTKFGDNGGAHTRDELAAYFAEYRRRGFFGFPDHEMGQVTKRALAPYLAPVAAAR